jgi:hypothetical protein
MLVEVNRKPEWFFYPGWIVLNAISIPIAWVISWGLISQVERVVGGTIQVGGQTHITEDFLLSYVFFPALGLSTGFLQYLLLRRYLPRMGWWIAATALGWPLAFVGIRLIPDTMFTALVADSMGFVVLAIVLVGGSIGLAQWLVLHQRVRHATWWILANVLGWGVAGLVGGGTISNLLDVLAFGLLPPIATGVAVWLLLDRLPQREGSGRDTPLSNVLDLIA